jgi:single-strand DNA-binding protein
MPQTLYPLLLLFRFGKGQKEYRKEMPDHPISFIEREGRNTFMLNKIMLIGNLGKDPELHITAEGTPFTRFSLAVNRSYTSSSGEKVEETEWFNIVAWRQLAEICERYLHKGSKVYLEGRLSQRKYTDREGVQRTSVEVIASEMEMLSPKPVLSGVEAERNHDPFLPDLPEDAS